MTDASDLVRLVVNGVEFGGWKNVRIESGIERQARSFDLEVTDRWPGATDIPRRIRAGDSCELYIGADRVATGYVDATPIRYDGHSVTVGVRGRSKTADLVDCCPIQGSKGGGGGEAAKGNRWKKLGVQSIDGKGGAAPAARAVPGNASGGSGGQWRGQKLEQIAADMAAPYDVKVVAEVDTGASIAHQVQQGETVFESIDRMLRMRHCLATDNAMGELVFVVAGSGGKATTALEFGGNILAGEAELDFKKVFSEYICKGQRSITSQQTDENEEGDDVESAVTSSVGTSAAVTDDRVGRRRVLVLKQSGQADEGTCGDRVAFERAHRAAKALETLYTVAGWRQDSGDLWLQNQSVRVVDGLIGFDTEMLIAEVRLLLDEQGLRTELKVGPVDGYVSAAQKKQKGKNSKNVKIVKDRYAGKLGLKGVISE
ncbi:phage baseplate assembly protein [Variovorax sp. RCC_210]|uniref:phage baseplate assembly protein n=1 Tax=Variovorax sp. RCC_210 TaxID=3239217 RepID=UPI0035251F87